MSRVNKKFKVVVVTTDEDYGADHGFDVGTVVTCVEDDGSSRCLYEGPLNDDYSEFEGDVGTQWVNDSDLEEVEDE